MRLLNLEFANQLALLQYEPTLTHEILDTDALARQALQFHELGIRRTPPPVSERSQLSQGCRGDGLRRRELLTER